MAATEFDRYRVTIFDNDRSPDQHFKLLSDAIKANTLPDSHSYVELAQQIGRCGAIQIAGGSAALFVSMLTATMAITRAIAIVSGCAVASEAGWVLARSKPRRGSTFKPNSRGVKHAGHPALAATK